MAWRGVLWTLTALLVASAPTLQAGPPAPSAPAGLDHHEDRVVAERYVAGAGDLGCAVTGVGCVRFTTQAGESTARFTIRDDVFVNAAGDVCSPGCADVQVNFCNDVVVTGLTPGTMLFVFLEEARQPLSCGFNRVGGAVAGTVTARFS